MNFDEEDVFASSLVALERGIKQEARLPERGESIPIARWAGATVGAVLQLQWAWGHSDPSDDHLLTEIVCFRRTDQGWKEATSRGGGSWPGTDVCKTLGVDVVDLGEFCTGDGVCARYGFAELVNGVIELRSGSVESHNLESSYGAWIVAFESAVRMTIKMYSQQSAIWSVVVGVTSDPHS
jgi:hypothetical protein